MGAPPQASSPAADAGGTPGLAFAEAWAILVRSLAFYPETNSRVQSSLDHALALLAAAAGGRELRIAFSRREAFAGGERAELAEGSNLTWLWSRLDGCQLAGAAFDPAPGRAALLAFSRQVLDGYRRSALDADFDRWRADPLPGVRVLERRFEGEFDELEGGADGIDQDSSRVDGVPGGRPPRTREEHLAAALLGDERVRERVARFAVRPAGGAEGETLAALDLVSHLVRALPSESLGSRDDAVTHLLQILDFLNPELLETEQELGRALLDAALKLFGREMPDRPDEEGKETEQDSRAPRGHARDEAITDDLDALLHEIAELPPSGTADVQLRHADSAAEQTGVMLHYLVTLEAEQEADAVHAPLALLLGDANPTVLEALRPYVERLRERGRGEAAERHRRRLLQLLQELHLTRLLVRLGGFDEDLAVELFPDAFGTWVESIDLRLAAERAQLLRVLERVGSKRILDASSQLVSDEHITEPALVRKLLGHPHPGLAPLARIVLARGAKSLKGTVALFVRKLEPGVEEACLLPLLRDEELPRDYLAALLEPPATPAARAQLHRRISEALCNFVENTAGDPARRTERLEAVQWLGMFQTSRAVALLRGLLRARRFLLLPRESRAVRSAARQALTSHV